MNDHPSAHRARLYQRRVAAATMPHRAGVFIGSPSWFEVKYRPIL
jgi:hypothetical protein